MLSKKPMSEGAFLAQQAADARAAMAKAACDLTRNGAVVLSPRMWVKEHPWAFGIPAAGMSGIGALLSFLFLRKKRQQQTGGLFSRLFSRRSEPRREPLRKKALLWIILEQAFSMAQPALFSVIASLVGSRFSHRADGQAGDGGQVR
jgi:cobalamin synthase